MRKLTILLFFVSMILVGCGKDDKAYDPNSDCFAAYVKSEPVTPLDGRSPILIVGDSISIGYTPYIQSAYPGKQAVHVPGNAQSSNYGACKIEEWSSQAPEWEVCILNHGLWDALIGDYPWKTSPEEYRANISKEISVLKNRCQKIVVANTTRKPENNHDHDQARLTAYNQIMAELAVETNVKFCDLYSVSETISHLHIRAEFQDDVHYINEGSQILADELENCIDSI